MSDEVERNKELCNRYPFLIPRNVWTDEIVEDYDYSWTLADDVDSGWKKLFLQMCEDILEPLIKANYLNKFRFTQIKEKYGTLRCYNNGAPNEVHKVIYKYEYMSQFVCIECGSTDAQEYDDGWVCPYCKDCFSKKKIHQDKAKEELDKYIVGEKFQPTFIITKYLPGGIEEQETIDVSNEWRRLNDQ